MTTYSLAYFYDIKDSTACLFKDNELIYCKEEERFTRIRHYAGFPYNAINDALKYAGIEFKDLDYVIGKDVSKLIATKFTRQCLKEVSTKEDLDSVISSVLATRSALAKNMCHHIAHAAQAFATSGFDSAAFLVADGVGDKNDSITIGEISANDCKIFKVFSADASLGRLYNDVTAFAGFDHHSEGKLMGLSSYGADTGIRALEFKDGEINRLCSTSEFCHSIYPFVENEHKQYDALQYANLAATTQAQVNEVLLDVVRYLKSKTNATKLVMSGGCMQNCVANNLICESGLFDEYYCSPIPYDGGTCIGDCFAYANVDKARRIDYPCTGLVYDVPSTETAHTSSGLSIENIDRESIVYKLINGEILGWFQGASEFGPRALGHRSFLANPAIVGNHYKLNEIKRREVWRPLAPIVPEELFDEVFKVKKHDLFQFMLRTAKIENEKYRRMLKAVCHVDGTTRPQLLKREWNPELYDLIMSFYEKTGIPALINTSLNTRGRPIVETPDDAIQEIVIGTNTPVVFEGYRLVKLYSNDSI